MEPLVLASASPRRKALLEQLGLPVEVDPVADAEPAPASGEAPLDYVRRATRAKADAALSRARARRDPRWIVAADTVVIVDEEVLGKPSGRDQARQMLARLSGRAHEVATGLYVGRAVGPEHLELVRTRVHMRPLRAGELEGYLDAGEWEGKAGAYAVQGLAAFFVRAVEGSYPNVVGLPVCELIEVLWQLGALSRFPLAAPGPGLARGGGLDG